MGTGPVEHSATSAGGTPHDALTVDPSRVLRFLLTIDGLLIGLHVMAEWLGFNGERVFGLAFAAHDILNMDREASIPTWWQQLVLAVGSALALLLSVLLRGADRRVHRYWAALGVIFMLMSIDEGAEIHERLIEPLRSAFDVTAGILWFAWVIPASAGLVVFAAVFFRFWQQLPPRPRRYMALAGVVFVAGALGVEMASGAYSSTREPNFVYSLYNAAEEGLEMFGSTLFLFSLLLMVEDALDGRSLRAAVRSAGTTAPAAGS